MPDQAFMQVSYEGATYSVPSELMSADVRNGSTLVLQHIEEQNADAKFRAQQSKKQQNKQLVSEVAGFSKRLIAVETENKINQNLRLENESLRSTLEAVLQQNEALQFILKW